MANRDNGFVAQHYAMLADLDPRLADAMLAVLRAAGIAAYVVPSTGSIGGYLDVRLPERPRDRLWVDREQHAPHGLCGIARDEPHGVPRLGGAGRVEPVEHADDLGERRCCCPVVGHGVNATCRATAGAST